MPRIILLALLALVILGAPGAAVSSEISTIVVRFGGDEQLGRAVATILNLEIWRSLRQAPTPNPRRLNFGAGNMIYYDQEPEEASHSFSERLAKTAEFSAQIVLWGHAHPIGQSVLATAYLTLPDYFDFRKDRSELWSLSVNIGNEERVLTADLPQRHYDFRPLKLPADFVVKYSTPDAIGVYSERGGGRRLGLLGARYRLIDRGQGEYARVCTADQRKQCIGPLGWVELPLLGRDRPEIIDFVGGLIRVFRGDWEGALELFREVASDPRVPPAIAIDARLLTIRALSELGRAADNDIAAVKAQSAPSRRVIQYIAMHLIHRCYASGTGVRPDCGVRDGRELAELIDAMRPLFAADDSWYTTVQALVRTRAR